MTYKRESKTEASIRQSEPNAVVEFFGFDIVPTSSSRR
jgi:hypothetical protein